MLRCEGLRWNRLNSVFYRGHSHHIRYSVNSKFRREIQCWVQGRIPACCNSSSRCCHSIVGELGAGWPSIPAPVDRNRIGVRAALGSFFCFWGFQSIVELLKSWCKSKLFMCYLEWNLPPTSLQQLTPSSWANRAAINCFLVMVGRERGACSAAFTPFLGFMSARWAHVSGSGLK